MKAIIEFIQTYRMYAKHHSKRYALRIAYGCAFKGLPF